MQARKLLFLFIIALSSFSQDYKNKPQQPKQTPASNQRGTEQSPLFVKTILTPKTQEETERDEADRKEKSANDRHAMQLTVALAVIAFLQFLVYAYQSWKLKQTVKAAGEQSAAMERHIGEATRSANAMEKIATVIDSGNVAIMRAYLSVVIGAANYQDRQEGIKFEAKPLLVNTGSTPARNVRIWIGARIIPHPQAEAFNYARPNEVAKATGVCAPHQNYGLSAIVADLIPDVEVPDIKHGRTGALTVWGIVTYDDIFGEHHTTKFGQWLFWYPNQNVYGYYIPGQNDMD